MVLEIEERVARDSQKVERARIGERVFAIVVVARISPLRWIKDEPAPLEDVLKTMRERVTKFNVEKVKPQELAGGAGPPDDETRKREDHE